MLLTKIQSNRVTKLETELIKEITGQDYLMGGVIDHYIEKRLVSKMYTILVIIPFKKGRNKYRWIFDSKIEKNYVKYAYAFISRLSSTLTLD